MHGAVEFMMKRLEERKKAFKPEVTNDYIDFFLHRKQQPERPEDSKHFTGARAYCTRISEVTATSGTKHSLFNTITYSLVLYCVPYYQQSALCTNSTMFYC